MLADLDGGIALSQKPNPKNYETRHFPFQWKPQNERAHAEKQDGANPKF